MAEMWMADVWRPSGWNDPSTALFPYSSFQPLAPGTLMRSRYRVVSQLGKGGMGYVYLVQDENFDARPLRSMKEMIPRLDDRQQHLHMVNFKREADVLETLRHSNIPRVYDSFTEFRRAYLVLEYVEGEDLEQVLDRTKTFLSPQQVGSWMIQLCTIVEYLHFHKPPIIFRDLKPSNVILTPDQRIILIDFGIAKVFTADEKQTNVGTQGYAAREQYKGEAEIRSDVYALGGMMHHLLTKSDPRFQPPFSFHERPPSRLNPAVTPELERVIMRCLEDDRDKRYQSVTELREALEDALHLSDTSYFRTLDKVGNGPARGPVFNGRSSGTITTISMSRSLRQRWYFRTEEEVRSTPTVANGVVYVGSYDNNVYALNIQNGALLWKYATEGGVCCQPAVWRSAVIFGSEDFYVYAVDTNGKELWRYRTHHHVRSSPRIYEDRLYIGSDDAHMHAIDPRTGRMIWRFRAYREVQTSAAFAKDLIYFGASDEFCYAVDKLTGEKKWASRAQAAIVSSPAVAGEYVYFGAMDFGVYALDAKSGWQAWREPTEKFVISSPRVVGDRLYIGSSDRHLHCLDRRTGKHLWKYPAGQQVTSTPAFYNNVIYFGCVDGALYALDAASGKLLGRFETRDKICGSPIVEEGVVYVGSSDGCVYALDAIS